MMNETLKKANEALLEGDRDGVLELLRYESDTPEVLWLRANAVLDNDERVALLQDLADGYSQYQQLAGEFLKRERDYQAQLDEPPDHFFWKQPTWEKRLEKMRAQWVWVLGAVVLLIMGITLLNYEAQRREEFQTGVLSVQATLTQEARFLGQTVVEYDAGRLSIVSIEDPTTKNVTFGRSEKDQYILATPATGARFVAVQFNFFCNQALCNQPPHANLALNLNNGGSVAYSSSAPFLVQFPPDNLPRISQGQQTKVWYVFEVPKGVSPKSVSVFVEGRDDPLFLSWTGR